MVEPVTNIITIDSSSRIETNVEIVPDNSDFCFTVKIEGDENIYDDDYEQMNYKIEFDWCTPVFQIAEPIIYVDYNIGTGMYEYPIKSQEVSGCSNTTFSA